MVLTLIESVEPPVTDSSSVIAGAGVAVGVGV
jgi:hypothetical protein